MDPSLKKLDEFDYRKLLIQAPQIMTWVSNPRFECVHVSPAMSEFTGVPLEEALGQGWQKAIHPEDLPLVVGYKDLSPNQRSFRAEYRIRRRDGEYRWAMDIAVPLFGAKHEFRGCMGLVVDIHEQKLSAPPEFGFSKKNAGVDRLSDRELQVLKFIGEGAGTRHIAQELSLSVKTVNCYLDRIKKKLKLDSLNKLIRFAALWTSNPLFPVMLHQAKIYSTPAAAAPKNLQV